MTMSTKNTEVMNAAGGEIVLYQPDESVKLEVRLEGETVWLTQVQMVELFRTTKQNISLHIGNIYKEGELDESSTVKEYLTVQNEGGRSIRRRVKIYNLDVIISVGYRIKSQVGTRFRIWATGVLKDYLLRGYSVNRQLVAMQERVDERFQAIQSQIDEQRDKVEFLVKIHDRPTEQLFPTGCVFDAYSFMADLIRSAKERVVLVDNYCDDKTLTLLDHRASGVECTIHTTFNKTIKEALEKHNAQCEPIRKIQLPHKIHDRFLILDQQVYLLGTSLKDMGHTLSAVILTGFTAQEILEKLG